MSTDNEMIALLKEIKEEQKAYHEKAENRFKKALENDKINQNRNKIRIRNSYIITFIIFLIILAYIYIPNLLYHNWQNKSMPNQDLTYLITQKHYEAVDWLKRNKNIHCFASNRFNDKSLALDFVQNLYTNGTIAVYISDVKDSQDIVYSEEAPYSDSMIIVLPEDKFNRKEIFKIGNFEAVNQGFREERDVGQKVLYLWWD